ncbi:MAG: methyltransferase domain-containing protein [Draconibacterium sp.]|nr:methyltransferase domain-containing protein [Draconibacterium sp.]
MLDLSDKNLEKNHPELIESFDTIFALNVVEHIPDHEQAIKNALKMLRKGGKIIILVPAFQGLYNGFDKQLDHQRRYTQKSLFTLLEGNGFQVIHRQYFNLMELLAGFFQVNFRKKNIPTGQMKLYNELVPL